MPLETPKRLPLVAVPSNRGTDTNKDAKLVNCYAQKDESDTYQIYNRPGILIFQTQVGAGEGVYQWRSNTYSIFGTTFFKDGAAIPGLVDGTNGKYIFSQCQGATPKLVFGNGIKAYTYDAGAGLVQITNVNFPVAFVKGWAYLDATLYVMDASGNIFGSGLNDPQTWTALNKIVANVDAGAGVALAKQLAYVVAFKEWSTEVFFDANNPTGSPLSAAQNAFIVWGCASADSVQDADGVLYWLAINQHSKLEVMAMENMATKPIASKAVERLLNGVDFSKIYSWYMSAMGYRFYGITFVNSNLTLVYDITEGLWHQWTDSAGNYWPMIAYVSTNGLKQIFQHATNGKLYYCDYSYTNDDGAVFFKDIVTPNFDGDSRKGKYVKWFEILADQEPGSIVYVRNSDDDYITWSDFRAVDLGNKRPRFENGGTFYKRAYHIRHQGDQKLRIKAIELDMDECIL